MIGYLEGKLMKREPDRILLLANQVGYEVLLPAVVMRRVAEKASGEAVALFIYYYQTERQPKPVLIGFHSEIEKAFFQRFISVDAIGPLKAVKALHLPVQEIAHAIERGDTKALKQLDGIGERTAQKIVAALRGKMDGFVGEPRQAPAASPRMDTDVVASVMAVLVSQLGYKTIDARQMIADAMQRNRAIASAEQLIDEIFQGEPR